MRRQLQHWTCRGVHCQGSRRADQALHPRRLAACAVRQIKLHLPAAVRGALGVPSVPAWSLSILKCIVVPIDKPPLEL